MSGGSLFDPKTPEAAAYMAQRDETRKSRATIWRRTALALGLALTISTGTAIYNGMTTAKIAGSQNKVEAVARCEERAFDAIVKLAFTKHVKNAAAYLKATEGC